MSDGRQDKAGRLRDRVAIITGGASGIGRATGHTLAAEGARIVLVDIVAEQIDAVLRELKGDGEGASVDTLGLALDIRREEDVAGMARATLDRFGHIDILVACAGILRAPGTLPKPMVQLSVDEWDAVIDTNLKGVFLSNRAVLPAMIAQRSGIIVNLSSTSGRQGRAHDAAYCASKFGVIGLSESLAEEVRQYGVKVQVVLPDAVDTPIWEQNGPIRPEQALAPSRVADLILYLVTLPTDMVLLGPVIAPFRTRRRVAASEAPGRKPEPATEPTS